MRHAFTALYVSELLISRFADTCSKPLMLRVVLLASPSLLFPSVSEDFYLTERPSALIELHV